MPRPIARILAVTVVALIVTQPGQRVLRNVITRRLAG
jgi:hypothetical protein